MLIRSDAIPEVLKFIVLLYDDVPVQGVLLNITFRTNVKNNYSQIHGPSSATGYISITKKCILNEAEKDANFFPSDYSPLDSVYAGSFEAEVMERDAIERAIKAYDSFSSFYDYPEGYNDMLAQALVCSQKVDLGKVSVLSVS
jgi:hypothetical protein